MTTVKKSLGAKPILYPAPVLLVGTYDEVGKPNLMNAAWGGICCSEPVCVTVSVRHSRWTYNAILYRKAFTLSIPTVKIMNEADFVGIASGKNYDKFAETGLTPVRAEHVDAPYVGECPVVVECELYKTLDLGAHVMMVGKVVDVKADIDCLTDDGLKPDLNKFSPLVFDMGNADYRFIGEKAGDAFSAGKVFLAKK